MEQSDLPIHELAVTIGETLRAGNRLILQAPTGSGKSTQVPQMLLDQGFLEQGIVIVLQPRRLAARMLAARVASERKSALGAEVGYQIRLDDYSSKETRILYVTEGILLRRMLSDPALKGVAALVFDEFHERHLYGDVSLARALDLQEGGRPDLKVVVMSATLDGETLARQLAPCKTLISEGRTFPVRIDYIDKPLNTERYPIWDAAADEFDRVAMKEKEGDFLIFMPGSYEIQRTIQAVRATKAGNDFVVLPLHGELPPEEQDAAVAKASKRKVIVSTNVAETSLTIDGVRVVIDSGLARIARFDPHRGINTFLVEKISRASSDQRAGRAGRTAPGVCLRLWTEQEHQTRAPRETPEVKRLDLAEVVLTLKASGVEDVSKFRWLEHPEEKALARAEILLKDLGALDEKGRISAMGRRLLVFPTHPRYGRMFLAAEELKCVRAAALIAALTQSRSILIRNPGKAIEENREELWGGEAASDFFVLMRAWRYAERCGFDARKCQGFGIHAQGARQVGQLFRQFLDIAEKERLDISEKAAEGSAIQKCILAGFSDQLARRKDVGTLRCDLVHGRRGVLARECVVQKNPLLVAAEIREVDKSDGELATLLSLATAVEEEWLKELFPSDFSASVETRLNPTTRRVVSITKRQFRDLVLEEKSSDSPNMDEAARILAAEVLAGRFPLEKWDDEVEQWIFRLNRLSEWMPELSLPRIGPEDRVDLMEQICHGALGYKEIKERPVWPVVKSWLSQEQQHWLEKYAPERYELPGGRKAKITYAADGEPSVSARIQDLYGVEGELKIAAGRVLLKIYVLAPNQRPVQTTSNLSTFWRESYPKLKLELQRKYPKHQWL